MELFADSVEFPDMLARILPKNHKNRPQKMTKFCDLLSDSTQYCAKKAIIEILGVHFWGVRNEGECPFPAKITNFGVRNFFKKFLNFYLNLLANKNYKNI